MPSARREDCVIVRPTKTRENDELTNEESARLERELRRIEDGEGRMSLTERMLSDPSI